MFTNFKKKKKSFLEFQNLKQFWSGYYGNNPTFDMKKGNFVKYKNGIKQLGSVENKHLFWSFDNKTNLSCCTFHHLSLIKTNPPKQYTC